MADIEDVLATLTAVVAGAVYPQGLAAPSVTGEPTKVRIGWPDSEQLAAEAEAGITNVTVYPDGVERNLTEVISPPWEALPAVPPTLLATVAGETVTFSGVPAAGQLAAIVMPHLSVVYAVQPGDTLAAIATALAALLSASGWVAGSAGAVLTLVGGVTPAARIGQPTGMVRELGRQSRQIRISVWTADPVARSTAAAAIDQALRPLTRLRLPDGTTASLRYAGSPMSDAADKDRIYRRDVLTDAEFIAVTTMQGTPILAPRVTIGTAVPVSFTS